MIGTIFLAALSALAVLLVALCFTSASPTPIQYLIKVLPKRLTGGDPIDDVGDALVEHFIDVKNKVFWPTVAQSNGCGFKDNVRCSYIPKKDSVAFFLPNMYMIENSDMNVPNNWWAYAPKDIK